MSTKFSILISTKNRLDDLKITLQNIAFLIDNDSEVECMVCDDGSTDGTTAYISSNYPKIHLISNKLSKGYLYNRNYMLNNTSALYAISLDDDAHFLSAKNLDVIEEYFDKKSSCGLIAFRVFWGLEQPENLVTGDKAHQVNGFVGCGHVWRMAAWKSIPNYPEWFQFYGEEQFASIQLFRNGWEVHYLPEILVHHRVNMNLRKSNSDYLNRQRRSLSSGWYLFFLCYPKRLMFKSFFSSLWSQVKRKTFKGNWGATNAILKALMDVLMHNQKFIFSNYRMGIKEYREFNKLQSSKVYWKPTDKFDKTEA
ncbi:glycosyltransferase family 2 protein [Gelidibacter japonicus]|uniref:glycosyltransferase family 2 protein n=1 Tax=Gelidibacter japonicus TaxID=1962232 RepID=UPI0013D58A80|nr:glycosyltransferase [Gelidibacter japonicus]